MAEDVEDLTVNYEEDGIPVVKELDKAVLSKGAWATIIFRYQQWDKRKEEYGEDKYTIRRYRKINGEYIPRTRFNISSSKQAAKIVEILSNWLDK
ncbi:MAG: hypothetical protein ACQES8_05385 [Thermodesulfobacteriota bacterium]